MNKKKIKDLTLGEILKIHNTTPCYKCPLKDENQNCLRTGTVYKFSEEFLNKEIEVEEDVD